MGARANSPIISTSSVTVGILVVVEVIVIGGFVVVVVVPCGRKRSSHEGVQMAEARVT
jgi:hypothetical protein